jgi:hypothetical protein
MSEAKLNPSKRLKNWHRKYGVGMPLRAYARSLRQAAANLGDHADLDLNGMAAVAGKWLASKGLMP